MHKNEGTGEIVNDREIQVCEMKVQVQAYHDNQLSDAARQQMEQHLTNCQPCTEELSLLARLSERFASFAPVRLSQIALARLHQHVDQQVQLLDQNILRFARRMTGLAAMILIGCMVWMMKTSTASDAPLVANGPVASPAQTTESTLIAFLDDSANSSSVSTTDSASATDLVIQDLLN